MSSPRAGLVVLVALVVAGCSGAPTPMLEALTPSLPSSSEDAGASIDATAGAGGPDAFAPPTVADAAPPVADAHLVEDGAVGVDVQVPDAAPDAAPVALDAAPDVEVDAAPPPCTPIPVPPACGSSPSAWTCPDAGPTAIPGYGTLIMSCTEASGVWCCPCAPEPAQQSLCADAAPIPTTSWTCTAGYAPGECNPVGGLFCCGE